MDTATLILLCIFAFSAGFVDAIVGGGGLIQTPASLVLLPQFPIATVIGSLKLPSFTGTGFATIQYLKNVTIQWRITAFMCMTAFIAAFAGSETLTIVSNRYMKPIIFIVLILVAVYTYSKKDFGQQQAKKISSGKEWVYAFLISLVIGFYDGFIGPGAGSFLILAFIALMRFDFLHASANAKLINLSTNTGSIILFLIKGSILWSVAIPMAVCNGLGGVAGAKLALAKGNRFIRIFFLLIITATLIRFGYDVFFK